MEHEVFVPVPVERLREVLDDPARVARAVPGLQQDAGADPVAGRLKVRVGSHSITYRGAVRVSRQDDGVYAMEGEATESRGTGTVELTLRVALWDAEGGATVAFHGTASADGRVEDLPADAVEAAVVRLLNRFAEHLGAAVEEPPPPLATQDFEPRATTDYETTPDADDAPAPGPAGGDLAAGASGSGEDVSASEPAEGTRGSESADGTSGSESADGTPASEPGDEPPAPTPSPEASSVFGAEVPPSSLGPSAQDEEDEEDEDTEPGAGDSVAEAAHARRTMIGRSAEEVDHAPPRGRYAPVPAPQTVTPTAPLRWAAPAAALALASAIVAVRALRRRR